MAAPVEVSVAETWTKVATAAETGTVWILDTGETYEHTWVDTGDAAPDEDPDVDPPVLITGNHIMITASGRPIDVYMRIKTADHLGSVRVDA